MLPKMNPQSFLQGEISSANLALKGFFACVGPLVIPESPLRAVDIVAKAALERFLVGSQMNDQIVSNDETRAAVLLRAAKRPNIRMHPFNVLFEVIIAGEVLAAFAALMSLAAAVVNAFLVEFKVMRAQKGFSAFSALILLFPPIVVGVFRRLEI